MKKIFIALSVMAALAFSLAPVQANVPGARDISPGSECKVWFLVSQDRVDTGSGPSTLLQISETKGLVNLSIPQSVLWSNLHWNFYTRDSVWVHDVKEPITRWQTILRDVGAILADMSDTERNQLLVTFEGENYYAGYIVITEIRWGNMDNILVDAIQADLSSGLAAMANIPMKAWADDGVACDQFRRLLTGVDPTTPGTVTEVLDFQEVFSGDAMAASQEIAWGNPCADASWFALYPRYLINDANSAKTYWLFLRSSLTNLDDGTAITEVPFHTWVINKAEEYRSTTIPIRELSILDAGSVIPDSLKLSLPYIGQVNLKIPGEINPGTGLFTPSSAFLGMELVGWNWKMANDPGNANLNWAGLTMMAADAGTTTVGPFPNY